MTTIDTTQYRNASLRDGSRPPLELLPTDVANLLVERDRIAIQLQAADIKVRELAGTHLDEDAERQDADAASNAARAGKPIPKTSRSQKLADDRAQAAREYAAQGAAMQAVIDEARTAMSNAYPWDTIAADRAKLRAELEAAAHALADRVDAAVKADAAVEWLRSEAFSHQAPRAPIQNLVDMSRLNVTDLNQSDLLRDVIVNAATAPFATEES